MPSTDAPDRPPGWYADPADGARLTYWDGRRWTNRHRPRPSWQSAADASRPIADVLVDPAPTSADSPADGSQADPRARRPHGPRTWIVVGATLLLVVGLAWITLPKPDDPGPRVLTDTAFVDAANAECKATINGLRPPLPGDTANGPTRAQLADSIVHTADGLDALAGRLRSIPAAAADQPHIAAWLSDWNRYTAIGRDYAVAMRANTPDETRLSSRGDDVQQSADRFARANGLKSCQFFIVPRGTGSDPFSGGA